MHANFVITVRETVRPGLFFAASFIVLFYLKIRSTFREVHGRTSVGESGGLQCTLGGGL